MWVQYSQIADVYFVSQTNWAGHTHYYGIGATGPFSNGYIPMFAVIGDGNVCYYNDNPISNVEAALILAIESFGLAAHFESNLTNGPLDLGVQFYDSSIAPNGIDSWEWDFDGDGITDSYEQDPFFLYTELGNYDVSLTITSDGETVTETIIDYITVTDAGSVSGCVAGIWRAEYGPYTITDDVTIPADGDLTVEPGVEIYTENGAQFSINGSLQADASTRDGEPIIFTSNSSWQGLRFIGTQANNIIANCEISKATVSAIRIENDSSLDIIGNKIYDNSSISLGAAIDVTGSTDILITQNIIANNFSSNAIGGIQCTNAPIEITNNIIVNNSGTYGAFMLKNDSDAELTNNTIANNESNGTNQYLFFIFNSAPVIRNCIIIDSNSIFFASGTVDVTYTCISGGYTGTGNIDEDPLFMAPSAGNGIAFNGLNAHWWLQEGSPCIDAGDPDAMYNDPDGSRNDMGAYGGPNGMTPTDAENNVVNIITRNSISVYPNPFNPETNIALSITAQDLEHPVSLGIYNIKGQLVKTLVDNEVVNNSTFIWDGTDNNLVNTSSGMYFVKMKTVSNFTAKKMILLK